jgi:replicative DNA helicase Mcm
MFGGVTKHKKDITIRGNIHVLFVGDPSTAKSQLLRTIAELSPRGLYSSGQGVSGVGLTAALSKDPDGEWVINAGVLVLADKGVACIDEIDKMRDDDRVNIHEAMAQQTVTISKAGLHNTLMARTAVIAAANPLLGRYDEFKSVFENLRKFPPTLFSRFDLIFILIDRPEVEKDKHVLERIEEEETKTGTLDRDLFKKYIAYSKSINPKISPEARKLLRKHFLEIRAQMKKTGTQDRIPITYRQYEALSRLCEAYARLHLRKIADIMDAEMAIRLFDEFLEDIDFDVEQMETGKSKSLKTA